jgi:hypothetical protein
MAKQKYQQDRNTEKRHPSAQLQNVADNCAVPSCLRIVVIAVKHHLVG